MVSIQCGVLFSHEHRNDLIDCLHRWWEAHVWFCGAVLLTWPFYIRSRGSYCLETAIFLYSVVEAKWAWSLWNQLFSWILSCSSREVNTTATGLRWIRPPSMAADNPGFKATISFCWAPVRLHKWDSEWRRSLLQAWQLLWYGHTVGHYISGHDGVLYCRHDSCCGMGTLLGTTSPGMTAISQSSFTFGDKHS